MTGTAAACAMTTAVVLGQGSRSQWSVVSVLLIPAQAAVVATLYGGGQSLLVAAVLVWWRRRVSARWTQIPLAIVAAFFVTYASLFLVQRPWSWPHGWEPVSWLRQTCPPAVGLAIIYTIAQAMVFTTRAWRSANRQGCETTTP